ncbi:MAG: hypothetical protein WC742_09710 [Gallionellaceae bacterium]|jgi:hypothetical protein
MKKINTQTIELHLLAPPKPALQANCNGCGVCCAAEPCPVAILFLFQVSGRCRALVWQAKNFRYHCGMVIAPAQFSPLIPKKFQAPLGKFFSGRIATGTGCDCALEIDEASLKQQ